MLKFLCISVFFFCISGVAKSQDTQTSQVVYDYSFEFRNGIYLSFNDFRNNSPIPFEHIVSPSFGNDFFKKLTSVDEIVFYDKNGTMNQIPRTRVWGYASSGKPYIYWSKKFYLIPYIGTISHFLSTEQNSHFVNAYPSAYYDPFYMSSPPQQYTTEDVVHYFIDMRTGNILQYNSQNLLSLMADDEELSTDYAKLGKVKRSKSIMQFVQKYNSRHRISFNE